MDSRTRRTRPPRGVRPECPQRENDRGRIEKSRHGPDREEVISEWVPSMDRSEFELRRRPPKLVR